MRYADISPRTVIELTGEDRATLLHNLCTAEIKNLVPGQGTEAFVTNVKGKVIGHVFALIGEDRITLDTVEGQAEALLTHLDRYIIREDVLLHDRSGDFRHVVLFGDEDDQSVESLAGVRPRTMLEHAKANYEVVRTPLLDIPNYTLRLSMEQHSKLLDELEQLGAKACSSDEFEALRIQARFPYFAADITDDNLPQEVGRDELAISFTKGCYLGQETVARLDALGSVNWKLAVLNSDQSLQRNSELTREGSVVARVRSSVQNAALAYVKSAYAKAGTEIVTDQGAVTVARI